MSVLPPLKVWTKDRFKPTFEKHWESINDAEIFSRLKNLIGKEANGQFLGEDAYRQRGLR